MDKLNSTRILVIAVVIALLAQLSGCWSRQEIEELAFVTMAGIDLGQAPGTVRLTVHIAKPSAIAGQSGGQAQERQVSIHTSEGATIAAASANLAEQLPRQITWAHATVVVIGESYARAGIVGLVDFLIRTESARETVALMVVKGAAAWDLMQAKFDMDQLPSAAIVGMVHNSMRSASTTVLTTANDARRVLETQGAELTIAGVEVIARQRLEPDLRGELVRHSIPATAEIAGTAVFRGDRLVGWFDQERSRGLRWIRGDVQSSTLLVPHPTHPDETVSLKTKSGNSQVSVILSDEGPRVSISVKVLGSIGDSRASINPSDWEVIANLESALTSVVRSEISAAVDTAARQLRSDVFGFGSMLYRLDPRQWELLSNRWNETLQQIPVEVEVMAGILQTGFLVRGD